MIYALTLQAAGLLLFGVTKYQDSAKFIIATGILARLLNGFVILPLN
jgi:hypothetical protein